MARKILLIEDNPDDVVLTQMALANSGFQHELIQFTDGEEALNYLFHKGPYASLRPQDRPDLILLDLKMPGIDGFELLQTIKADAHTRIIPVVVLTISDADEDVLRSYELGASSCVRKRVHIKEFEETIRDMLAYWFTYTQLPPR